MIFSFSRPFGQVKALYKRAAAASDAGGAGVPEDPAQDRPVAKLPSVSTLRLYLASASPRRRRLLRQIGIEPVIVASSPEERALPGEPPRDLVRRLAEVKGRHAAGRLSAEVPGVVLAADTAVVIDGACLGKPSGPDEAAAMLRRLRGRSHEVLTGVFLMRTDRELSLSDLDSTRVHFRRYDEATIEAYVATGEASDKAGAYGIQGRGVLLAERIEGSWSNVVGLPLERLPAWTARIGVDLWELTDDRFPGA
jgi:septum formation protein